MCVCVVIVHWHCSAQLSMFDMEKRYRNKIIIIITLFFYCELLKQEGLLQTEVLWFAFDFLPRLFCLQSTLMKSFVISEHCLWFRSILSPHRSSVTSQNKIKNVVCIASCIYRCDIYRCQSWCKINFKRSIVFQNYFFMLQTMDLTSSRTS